MSETTYDQSLNAHYGRADLGTIILSSLRSAGKDLHALTPGDLAPVDHFHIRGKEATMNLARLAGLQRGMHVLDVGGAWVAQPARLRMSWAVESLSSTSPRNTAEWARISRLARVCAIK